MRLPPPPRVKIRAPPLVVEKWANWQREPFKTLVMTMVFWRYIVMTTQMACRCAKFHEEIHGKLHVNFYIDSLKNVSGLGLTSQCENREDVWMRSIVGGTQHIANAHNHKPISMPFFHIDPVWWWIDLNKLHHLLMVFSVTYYDYTIL